MSTLTNANIVINMDEKAFAILETIYGREQAGHLRPQITGLIQRYRERIEPRPVTHYFDQQDTVLITYADMVSRPGEKPLQTLAAFLRDQLPGVLNTIHLLPFYPASSDDGFSVIDYDAVDSALGDWPDVRKIGRDFKLMFDAVINHISAESEWFQRFLADEPPYNQYFITIDPHEDLTSVFRPRALPLRTRVQSAAGPLQVWTTFSEDQIDLNYANPAVLVEITDLLLFYISRGADMLRLDAIGFMWKESGTPCIHLPQAHGIIQFWRRILNLVAPQVAIITETNVPHLENISYFGDGTNEAQMVYNFSLPPLTLHAFHTGDATHLSSWAKTLSLPSNQVTFFNFLASHDGIGLTPARGLLPDLEIAAMAERVQQLGGLVSYRHNPDGTQSVYELNVNYLDALGRPEAAAEPVSVVAGRFLCAQAIMLALRGVPGLYFHSLFGSRGWPEGVQHTGRARTINRQKLLVTQLEAELNQTGSLRQIVFSGIKTLLGIRAHSPAFHPHGEQKVLDLHPAVFAVERVSMDGKEKVLCLHNVSDATITLYLPAGEYVDLRTNKPYDHQARVSMLPYEVLWLVWK